ncbi:Uncharacterised protein [Acinetobacter baumannii]|nr:hypothetical protein AB901B6_00137 [Acinetobacter baumannii]SSS46533.1 Uncharacterised protein [Acinetobacter baumannii]
MQFDLTLNVKLKDQVFKNLILKIYLLTLFILNSESITQFLSI